MKEPETRTLDDDICVHIFTVSATMVGVCLTVIGIIRLIITLQRQDLIIDDLVALNMLLYVVSAFCAYWSLRAHRTRRSQAVVRIADCVFLVALLFTAANAGFITWAMTSAPAP
ncbi:hypothetical protein [Pseudomonas sp. GCEP-101]|uniref:hypothetical protein n=1 Tax=Pseudomonas sp. GCEP-101 TaxID=2974552 RepID=UPI00223C2B92|nr:hypothetical protein [Pseudomonas sp. GCEP-101]